MSSRAKLRRPGDRHLVVSSLVLLPLVALLTWWALDDGGYAPVDWEPGLLLLAPLAVIALASPALRQGRRPGRAGLVGLGAFAAYTAWSYASIGWAGDPGVALEGAHRCALFLAAVALVSAVAPRPEVLRGLALALAGSIGLAAVVTLLRLANAEEAGDLLVDGRLAAPLGYTNASAALFATGALLGLVAASQRETPWFLRGPLAGLAILELGLAVLTASRGWLFTFPVVLVLVGVLVPGRWRFVLATAAAGLALAPVVGGLLEPVDVGGGLRPAEGAPLALAAMKDALGALWVAGLVGALAGLAWAAVDRRVVAGPRARRALRVGGVVTAVAALVAGVGVGLAIEPRPADRLDRAWQDFREDASPDADSATRFGSTGSSRYDFWRVAVDLTRNRPLAGIGQDNFEQPYVARRAIDYDEPRWVHSLPLRALTHTGIVGGLVLALALGALLATRLRHPDPPAAALALVPLAPWLLHGSVDWLWEFPVLSVGALALAAGAAARPADQPEPDRPARRSPPRLARAGVVGAGVLALACTAAVAVAYVAERDVAAAARTWPQDPAGAFARLDRAAGLTPSSQPFVVAGVIAVRLGDRDRARAAFARAAEREPGDWFAPFQLGLVAADQGRRADARVHLADAARRNPKEPVLQAARRALRSGERFGFAEADRLLRDRARARFGPP